MRCPNPDHICGFCTEFTMKDAEPEYAELGMGRCHGYDQDAMSPKRYVVWDEKCILFVRDKRNQGARRQFVDQQRAKGNS
jgi:hypothetical protein